MGCGEAHGWTRMGEVAGEDVGACVQVRGCGGANKSERDPHGGTSGWKGGGECEIPIENRENSYYI